MELGRYLTPEMINQLQADINLVGKTMKADGIKYAPSVTPDNVTYAYLPTEINGLFMKIEKDLQNTSDLTPWWNPYEFPTYLYQQDLYEGVKRWFDFVEYELKIINDEELMYEELKDNDGDFIFTLDEDNKYDHTLKTTEGYYSHKYRIKER